MISEMNVREQNQQTEDGVDQPEVVMDLTLSAYGRQPVPPDQPEEKGN